MKHHFANALAAALLFSATTSLTVAQGPDDALKNGSMEEGSAGEAPPGWIAAAPNGAAVTADPDRPFEGELSALVDASAATGSGRVFTNLMQSIDAAPWQGKRVRFRGAVRVANMAKGATAQLWMRVDRPEDEAGNRQMGAFDNMDDRPIRDTEWTQHDIVLDVADDAERIALGMFVLGKGKAWLDDVTVVEVDGEVEVTKKATNRRMPNIHPAVRKALAEAADAPQQPFFTHWLYLPLIAIAVFLFALWPRRIGDDGPPRVGAARSIAIWFTICYWLLYCLPRPFDGLIAAVGPLLNQAHNWLDAHLAALTGYVAFGIETELVPPNGSGDTTQNYLSILNGFVLSALIAVPLALWVRRFQHAHLLDLLRSYLRYVLAFAMLGYGLAKVSMEGNQFPVVGAWQLSKTWGDSSPMNVVWSFMGASRPYTIFAGLGEVLGAVLLIWRRTGTLGAFVTAGVMTNVVMINFCYDVPVKIYSSHLLLMALLIALPDIPRLFGLMIGNRAIEAPPNTSPWTGPVARWVRVVLKGSVIAFAFAWPIGERAWELWELATQPAEPAVVDPDAPMLTRRGFRWINEVPFNR